MKHIIVNINEAWFDVLDKEKVSRARYRLKKIKCDGLNDLDNFTKKKASLYCNKICRVKEKCSNDEILGNFRKEIVQFCTNVVKRDITVKSPRSGKRGRHAHWVNEDTIYFVSENGLLIIFGKAGMAYNIMSFYFPSKVNTSFHIAKKSTRHLFRRVATLEKIRKRVINNDDIHYEENF